MQTHTIYPKEAMARLFHSFLVVFLFLIGNSLLFAQNVAQQDGFGRVTGVVTDALTGETLPGANIVLKGNTSIGAPTNLDGQYTINRVPAGTVILVARYLGYATLEQEVTIERGGTIAVDFAMVPESITGQEIMVTAQAQGQQQAINQQINSDRIVNVVSESRIQELPDFNAAAALSRLPGVSTQRSSGEDNKVIIRGLAPEFNSIEIEGVRLSATGSSQMGLSSNQDITSTGISNDRSVDLTMVSPYMIRMISVYKALTPDMNANSIGGTVNMELREAPRGWHWDALWQQGYTAKSESYDNFRAVAAVSNRFIDNRLGVYFLINAESYDRSADNLNASYGTASSEIDPATGFRPVQVNTVTFNRHLETRQRFGGNLIMDYTLPRGSLKFVNMFARLNSDIADHNQQMNYSNGVMRWDIRLIDNQMDQQMNSLSLDYDFGFLSANISANYTSASNVMDRSPQISLNQTEGLQGGVTRHNVRPEDLTHLLTYKGLENVALRSANLFSNDYNEEKFTYKADFEIPFTVGRSASGFFKFGGQLDRQTNSVDQETPYVSFSGGGDGIQGAMMRGIEEQFGIIRHPAGYFSGTNFFTNRNRLLNPFLNDDYGNMFYATNPGSLVNILNYVVSNPNFDASNSEVSPGSTGGWYDGPYQALANDYEYKENYSATYAMARFNWMDVMVIGGVRYEHVDSEYFAYNALDARNAQQQVMYDTTATFGNNHLLPMAQMKYSPFEWVDIRYAYTQTLARPAYSQLSPKFTITTPANNVFAGNPDLKPAKAYNQDISLTFHANKLGLLSVGFFHKKIENFVYTARYNLIAAENAGVDSFSRYTITRLNTDGVPVNVVSPNRTQNPTVTRPVNNPNNATVRGIELELQTSFWYLPQPFNGIVFGVNYARIFSETTYPFFSTGVELREPPGGGRPVPTPVLEEGSRDGRLLFQPNHTLNSYLGYDFKGFSTRVSVLYQANSVTSINAQYPEGDYFTRDYYRIDFSARQKLPFAGSELFLDIANLNDAYNESAQWTSGGFSNVQNYGLTANIGIRIRR